MRLSHYFAGIVVVIGAFLSGPVFAACPYTFTPFTNGNPADAGPVLGNFNYILTCPQFTGNISIGTPPYSWGSAFDHVIDIGAATAIDTNSTNLVIDLMDNLYTNGTNYIAKTTNYGNLFRVSANNFQWLQGTFTNAGSATTLTRTMLLDYNGNLTITGCLYYNPSSLGTCLSDSRVKENVKPFTKAGLTEISALRPVTYSYNGLAGTPDDRTTGIAREGLIAQEVQKVAPQLISTVLRKLKPSDHAETALLEVDYGALTFGLINAVKELKVANDAQAGKTTVQAAEITRLRQQNTALAVQLKQQVADVQDVRTRLAALEHKVTFRTAENSIKPRH